MSGEQRPVWAVRLRAEREARGWNKREMARQLLRAAGYQHGSIDSLARQIRGWEAGEHFPRDWSAAYAKAFSTNETKLFGSRSPSTGSQPTVPAPVPLSSGISGLFALNDRPADADYVEGIRETSQHLAALDSRYGANDVFPVALRAFHTAYGKLAAGLFEAAVERDLTAATGELGEVAAWLAYDAGRLSESRQLIHEAILLSRMAGDRDMELFELSHLALLLIDLRRPAEVLRITEAVSDERLAPRVRALFDTRRGRSLAELGDLSGALDVLDKARVALAEGTTSRDPYWTWWLTDGKFSWHQGMAYVEVKDWSAAIPLLQDSADATSRRDLRARYYNLAHLLNAQIHANAWHDAEALIAEVMEQSTAIGSARTASVLTQVIRQVEQARTAANSTLVDSATELRRLLMST